MRPRGPRVTLEGVGEDVDSRFEGATGLFVENNLLSHDVAPSYQLSAVSYQRRQTSGQKTLPEG